MDLNSYKILGVINRTPNSFSDHGLSLDQSYFENQLQSFLADPTVIVDIGFESTAPMNAPISFAEEQARFSEFLEISKKFSFSGRFVSFDTYKIQNFLFMSEAFLKVHPDAHLIFNDVGGILDAELKEALLKFKGKNFYYIYTFSHIPDRLSVLDHMKFLDVDTGVIQATASAFKRACDWFSEFGMQEQLILDPGFGFSKSFEQNWKLIDEFDVLSKKLEALSIFNTILIGLSKKSFLKKALGGVDASKTEELHQDCLKKIAENSKHTLLFRVHDPKIVHQALGV